MMAMSNGYGYGPVVDKAYAEPAYETKLGSAQYVPEQTSPLATSCGRLTKSIDYLIEIVEKLEDKLSAQGFLKYADEVEGWPKNPTVLSVSPLEQYIQDRTNSIEYLQGKLQVLRERIDY